MTATMGPSTSLQDGHASIYGGQSDFVWLPARTMHPHVGPSVRVVPGRLTKSRKTPTRQTFPPFPASRSGRCLSYGAVGGEGRVAACVRRRLRRPDHQDYTRADPQRPLHGRQRQRHVRLSISPASSLAPTLFTPRSRSLAPSPSHSLASRPPKARSPVRCPAALKNPKSKWCSAELNFHGSP